MVRAEHADEAKLAAMEKRYASLEKEVDGFERFTKPRWLVMAEINGPGLMAGATLGPPMTTGPLGSPPTSDVGFGLGGASDMGITLGAGMSYLSGMRWMASYSFLPDLSASKGVGLLNVSMGRAQWFGLPNDHRLPNPTVINTWNPPHSWGWFNDVGVGWAHGAGGDGGGLRIRAGLQQYYNETVALEYGVDTGFIVGQEQANRVYLGLAVAIKWQPPRR